jgi:hypothetical protein
VIFSPGSSIAQPDIVFSVSNDQTLTPPVTSLFLPDEHTTILPAIEPISSPLKGSNLSRYNFFVAMANAVDCNRFPGTFVLQSSDFLNFIFAPGFGNADHGTAVFWPPHPLITGGDCHYTTVTHFDEQYAAPGSVLQDPTLPPGNLIMIYEAEIHCPPSSNGMAAGWISIGTTRSSDGGKTWPPPSPKPGFEANGLDYGNGRYAGITLYRTPPTKAADKFYGDALPSAFIDDMDPSGDYCIYVPYKFTGAPGSGGAPDVGNDPRIHMARAKIGDRSGHHEAGPLDFHKWYQNGWTEEGIAGHEEGVGLPCGTNCNEAGAQIEYNDALHCYIMTFLGTTFTCAPTCEPSELALYYSTATSLATQNWTPPQLIENSTYPVLVCNGHRIIDGGYPSFVSPGHKPGHIGHDGVVFLLKGDPLGSRQFVSRSFTIESDNNDNSRQAAKDKAVAAWNALEKWFGNSGPRYPNIFAESLPGPNGEVQPSYVWSQSQVAHAALDLARLTGNDSDCRRIVPTLKRYRLTNLGTTGYAPNIDPGNITPPPARWWDDNGLVGLVLFQASTQLRDSEYFLTVQKDLWPFFKAGQCRRGGQRENEAPSGQAISVGATSSDDQTLERLYLAMDAADPRRSEYLNFVLANDAFIKAKLRAPGGLYWDGDYPDIELSKNKWCDDTLINCVCSGTYWACNPCRKDLPLPQQLPPTPDICSWMFDDTQGFMIGSDLLLYRITCDPEYLQSAIRTASASLDYYTLNWLWVQDPWFNASYFIGLFQLDSYVHDPHIRASLEAYLDRAWTQGRDPNTGLFNRGGIGVHDPNRMRSLDQAAFVIMYSLLASPQNAFPD